MPSDWLNKPLMLLGSVPLPSAASRLVTSVASPIDSAVMTDASGAPGGRGHLVEQRGQHADGLLLADDRGWDRLRDH